MSRLRNVLVAGGVGATLFSAGCRGDEQLPTEMSAAVQAAKPAASLKVTPSQLNLSGVGVAATITASSPAEPISVAVSTPACVSVTLKSQKKDQSKFTVTAIAAGSCILTVTDGATGNLEVPVTVAATLVPTTLAAGSFHTCGLDGTGAAYCWGNNGYGQLGNTSTAGSVLANPTPAAVAGGLTFASLTAGINHTCGLTPAGAAYCWGGNYAGQLGNTTNSGVEFEENPTPLPVEGNLTFSLLEASVDHTCGITPQGVMYCWGKNSVGQLGSATNLGTSLPNPTPTPVGGGLTFLAVAAGTGHTCGVATGGVVYCWGNNYKGQLGNTTDLGVENGAQPTPTAVPGVPALASLAAGGNHNCALTAAGAAWCWGDNHFGQLAGTTDDISSTPVEVPGGLPFVSLGAGGGHTCGLVSEGYVYCWGGNLLGQLGHAVNFGTSNPAYAPTEVSGVSLAALAVKGAHTCGLTSAGAAWCWGFNRYGQLGTLTNNNTDTGVHTPEAVIGGLTFATP